MKKFAFFLVPLMAISFLTNCGGTKQYTVTFDPNGGKWTDRPTNNDNFPKSVLNDFLNGTSIYDIINLIPDSLKSAIKTVNKYVGTGDSYKSVESYSTKFFPLAHNEVVDHVDDAVPNEGSKYTFYKKPQITKYLIKSAVGATKGEDYWFRAPIQYNVERVYYCSFAGAMDTNSAKSTYAVAPAFCI